MNFNNTPIYDYLPIYHQMEVNNLKALHPGLVISQIPFKTNDDLLQKKFNLVSSTDTTVGTKVANGHIITFKADGLQKVGNAADRLFIAYNDPYTRLFNGYKFYATDLNEECVRAVELHPGDEWMSDIDYLATTTVGESTTYNYPGGQYLVNRIVKVDSTSAPTIKESDDFFDNTTLPDGTTGYHWIFIG